jgi:hypothetical protein
MTNEKIHETQSQINQTPKDVTGKKINHIKNLIKK